MTAPERTAVNRVQFDLFKFRNTVNENGNAVTEFVANVFYFDAAILDGVVKKPCGDQVGGQTQLRETQRNTDGMDNVGFARFPRLTLVGKKRVLVRRLHELDIVWTEVRLHLLHQLGERAFIPVPVRRPRRLSGLRNECRSSCHVGHRGPRIEPTAISCASVYTARLQSRNTPRCGILV